MIYIYIYESYNIYIYDTVYIDSINNPIRSIIYSCILGARIFISPVAQVAPPGRNGEALATVGVAWISLDWVSRNFFLKHP